MDGEWASHTVTILQGVVTMVPCRAVLHRSESVRVGVARSDGTLRDCVDAVMFKGLKLSQAVPMDGGPVVA